MVTNRQAPIITEKEETWGTVRVLKALASIRPGRAGRVKTKDRSPRGLWNPPSKRELDAAAAALRARHQLRQADLPDRQREALEHRAQGRSLAEIAELMGGISRTAVHKLLRKATKSKG